MHFSIIDKIEKFVFSVNIPRREQSRTKGGIIFNCPLTLIFVMSIFIVHLAYQTSFSSYVNEIFTLPSSFNWSDPRQYLRFLFYVFGDSGRWTRISEAIMLIVLLGPIVEERIGFLQLSIAVVGTAVINGVLHAFLFRSEAAGPTCIAYLLVFLASFVNFPRGRVPVSFLLVLIAVIVVSAEQWMQNFQQAFPMITGSILGCCWAMAVRRVTAKYA